MHYSKVVYLTQKERLVELLLARESYHHNLGNLRCALAEADADYLLENGVIVPGCSDTPKCDT